MKLYPLLRATLLLLLFIASATANSQTFTFDVRNVQTGDSYKASVNTSSKHIDVNSGSKSMFSATYVQAQALTGGVAFSFRQGQTPSLKPDMASWFFCIKPTTIGFNNPDTKLFVKADPTNSSSYTSTYNSLVAAINGTASNNVSSNNAPHNNNITSNNVSANNVPISSSTRTFTANGVSFTMVQVPGGTFTMGATSEQGSDAYSDESPTHQVTLSSYSIGQTEVTQELWEAVMGKNPSHFKGANRPVEQVTWKDCQKFISKLNKITHQNFRLPTEAEWEYAARSGKSGGTKYAGSNSIDEVAWYDGNSGNTTHEVATKRANSLGIFDMTGNVWEWCQDWYGVYSSSGQTNPQGPTKGSGRVSRGGSWHNNARHCRVSRRDGYDPDGRLSDIGLRLAL